MLNTDLKSLADVQDEYFVLFETINEEFSHLGDADKIKIAQLVTGVCGTCHDASSGCQCWNDD